jgi:nucleoside-diphosphate-sugar epimerase
MPERMLLLTGATGFVGGAVRPELAAKGWHVRCLTRDAARAKKREPSLDWAQGDVARIHPHALTRSTAARPRSIWCTGLARAKTTTGMR